MHSLSLSNVPHGSRYQLNLRTHNFLHEWDTELKVLSMLEQTLHKLIHASPIRSFSYLCLCPTWQPEGSITGSFTNMPSGLCSQIFVNAVASSQNCLMWPIIILANSLPSIKIWPQVRIHSFICLILNEHLLYASGMLWATKDKVV